MLLFLAIGQIQAMVEKLGQERLARPWITPHIDALQVVQVFESLQYLIPCLHMRVQIAFAHRRMHLGIVRAELSSLPRHFLCVLAKVGHFRVLVMELLKAGLLSQELVLPFLENADDCELLGVSLDLILRYKVGVELRHTVLRLDLVEVDIGEASYGLLPI